MAALDAQAAQIRLQSTQEAERLAQERNDILRLLQKVMPTSRARGLSHTPWTCMLAPRVQECAKCSQGEAHRGHRSLQHPSLQMLLIGLRGDPPSSCIRGWLLGCEMGPGHRVMITFLLSLLLLCAQEKEKLASLERRYQLVTGGRSFPKMSSALKEVTGGWSTVLRAALLRAELLPPQGQAWGTAVYICSSSSASQCHLSEAGHSHHSRLDRGLQGLSSSWEGGKCNRAGLGSSSISPVSLLGCCRSSEPACVVSWWHDRGRVPSGEGIAQLQSTSQPGSD